MKRHSNLISARLKEIYEEVTNDLKINEINIKEKALECPAIKSKWSMIYLEERRYYKKLEEARNLKIEEYIENHGRPGVPKIKTKDEAKRDINIKKIRKLLSDQKEVIDFLEGIIKIMSSLNFDIKNCLDVIKIEMM